MDKARSFEYVRRLPADTRVQLHFREEVYDRQVLLNEEWNSYALRTGKGDLAASEEHVKWISETWEEYELRKKRQSKLCDITRCGPADSSPLFPAASEEANATGKRTVARLAAYHESFEASRIAARHHLHADFDEYQRIKFSRERGLVEMEEMVMREKIRLSETGLWGGLVFIGQWDFSKQQALQQMREYAEEQERLRVEEERQRAEEEARRQEEERKRQEEEAERQRRAQAEMEKRMERKLREEERRAKARADRERQKEQPTDVEAEPAPAPAPPAPEPREEVEPEVAEETTPATVQPQRITFGALKGDDVTTLFKCISGMFSSGGDNCYIMAISRSPGTSTVVCQNGYVAADPHGQTPLLGKRIDSDSCVSVASPVLHSTLPNSAEQYLQSCVEAIPDVRSDPRCELFSSDSEKKEETLALFPLPSDLLGYSPYVLALCRDGVNAFHQSEIEECGKRAFELALWVNALSRAKYVSQLCQQCVEWVSSCTNCRNVYISLKTPENQDVALYVAATPAQRFIIGTKHSREEEERGAGISFTAMDASLAEMQTVPIYIEHVEQSLTGVLSSRGVRFFTDGEKSGALIAAPLTGEIDGVGCSVGMLFADRLGEKGTFSSVDSAVIQAAGQLLTDILLGKGNPALGSVHLQIEEKLPPGQPIVFLKALWCNATQNLQTITTGQLLELAKYVHPPPVIPLVVRATLLVALGCKPSKVEEWADARKRVTKKLLDRMLAFDPTNTKARKKPFFIRARKILKGITSTDVFEKGSFPAQCFFNWVFSALLLRKHAELLQKQSTEGFGSEVLDDEDVFSDAAETSERLEDSGDDGEDGDDDVQEEQAM